MLVRVQQSYKCVVAKAIAVTRQERQSDRADRDIRARDS